jgi:mono/diheme cytochrome c family protein
VLLGLAPLHPAGGARFPLSAAGPSEIGHGRSAETSFAGHVGAQGAVAPTTPKLGGNPAAAAIKNPVPSSTESIEAGRSTYARLCSRCHGREGKGDGAGAGAGGQPADFTDSKWEFGSSDGEIFSAIRDGTSADMDGYGERLMEHDIWNLVNFIRSLGPKGQ